MARRTAMWADLARSGHILFRFGQAGSGTWSGKRCDVAARWLEFGPPFGNLGRPRKVWADVVSIWAGGKWDVGRHKL